MSRVFLNWYCKHTKKGGGEVAFRVRLSLHHPRMEMLLTLLPSSLSTSTPHPHHLHTHVDIVEDLLVIMPAHVFVPLHPHPTKITGGNRRTARQLLARRLPSSFYIHTCPPPRPPTAKPTHDERPTPCRGGTHLLRLTPAAPCGSRALRRGPRRPLPQLPLPPSALLHRAPNGQFEQARVVEKGKIPVQAFLVV